MAVRDLLCDEQGQDIVEYALMLAFVALASAGLFIGAGGSVTSIWARADSALSGGGCPSGWSQDGNWDNGSPYCVSPSGQIQ